MTAFVVDASVAIAWCFEDEATPASRALLLGLPQAEAFVPPLWHWEVGNAVLTAERRGGLDAAAATRFLHLLQRLPIRTDTEAAARVFASTQALARQHSLTTYDAAYLELALRLHLPLATRDEALARAATQSGAPLLPA